MFKAVALSLALIISPTAAIAANQPPVDLYIVATSSSASQPCDRPSQTERSAIASAITSLVNFKLAGGTTVSTPPPEIDILGAALRKQSSSQRNVLIATYCKTGDVYTISFTGYAITPTSGAAAPPGAQVSLTATPLHPPIDALTFTFPLPSPSATAPTNTSTSPPTPSPSQTPYTLTSGSLSGTFDALNSADWSALFGPATSPIVPNVAFYPVANDSTGLVNARLLHNLPITVLATPPPVPAAPSPGVPQPPATRLDACTSSAYRMLISGRALESTQTNEVSRAIVTGAALKFNQPHPWDGYYGAAGAIVGLLYTPNSAEVSVDVFTCPPDTKDRLDWVGVLPYPHITGHKTTPALGTDVLSQQRAVDVAILDLENQLYCIIGHELQRMKITDSSGKRLVNDDLGQLGLSGEALSWCNTYYGKLTHITLSKAPIDAQSIP